MTYRTFTRQELSGSNIGSLKNIAAEHDITPTGDKRVSPTWIQAILSHQSKKKTATPDEQTLAQAELDQHITAQAEAAAPEQLTTVGISWDHDEIMAQIATECEKYSFEILESGIYEEERKLGEVGCTNGDWWIIPVGEQKGELIPCDSVEDAVWWLSIMQIPRIEADEYELLLERPLEELSPDEWAQLKQYKPQPVLA